MRAGSVQAQLFRWRKLFWLAAAIAVLLVGDAALVTLGPPNYAMALVRSLLAGGLPTIATAASFSVSAGSFATEGRASAFAAALHASGLPVFVRQRPDEDRWQVLVGPFVSTDEAEHAQRSLAAWGLGEARLVVDDTMRSRPQRAAIFGVADASSGVVMVAAGGMSSIVFEMREAPRTVEARRSSVTTLDIDIGEVTSPGEGDPLVLPDGVLLVDEVLVQPMSAEAMHARLVVPAEVQSRMRLEGRRVYIDLAWPEAPWQVGGRSRVTQTAQAAVGRDHPDVPPSTADAYEERFRAILDRYLEMQPFLLSAVESPEPDVLAALAHSLEGVRESLAGLTAPPDLESDRQVLAASVTLAASALHPAFAGDRALTVRQAIALYDANKQAYTQRAGGLSTTGPD